MVVADLVAGYHLPETVNGCHGVVVVVFFPLPDSLLSLVQREVIEFPFWLRDFDASENPQTRSLPLTSMGGGWPRVFPAQATSMDSKGHPLPL